MDNTETKTYKCQLKTKNKLKFRIVDNKALMDDAFIDEPEMRAFFLLLSHAIAELTEMEVTHLVQTVTHEDWEVLQKNNNWKVLHENRFLRTYLIECPIEHARECIAQGFGVFPDKIDSN